MQLLSVPIGTIIDYAGSSTPAGYLECDGSAVSRTAYAALFAALGTTWGAGDGSTTFNLPDLRGRTAIGAGTGTAGGATAHGLGDKGGDQRMHKHAHDHTLKLPNHAHSQKHRHGFPSPVLMWSGSSGGMLTSGTFWNGSDTLGKNYTNYDTTSTGNPTTTPSISGSVSSAGGGPSPTTRPTCLPTPPSGSSSARHRAGGLDGRHEVEPQASRGGRFHRERDRKRERYDVRLEGDTREIGLQRRWHRRHFVVAPVRDHHVGILEDGHKRVCGHQELHKLEHDGEHHHDRAVPAGLAAGGGFPQGGGAE